MWWLLVIPAAWVGKKILDASQNEPQKSGSTTPSLLPTFDERGELDGDKCVVIGRTGAGKSSLINMLTGQSALEVGAISSTTRWVEGAPVAIGSGKIILVDTPGYGEAFTAANYRLRLSNWIKEKRSSVKLIVLVLQADTKAHAEDYEIVQQLNRIIAVPVLIVLNQVDKIMPTREPLERTDWESESVRDTQKTRLIAEKIEEVSRQFQIDFRYVMPSIAIDGGFNATALRDAVGGHFNHALA
jgi:small GTP-binding protein